jgi:hypothetical protein
MMNFIDQKPTKCVTCFSSDPTHMEKGCPHCAKKGIIIKYDPTAAEIICNDYVACQSHTDACYGVGCDL